MASTTLNDVLAEMLRLRKSLQSDMFELKSSLQSEMLGLKTSFDDFRSEANERFSTFDTNFRSISSQIGTVDEAVNASNGKISSLSSQIATVNSEICGLMSDRAREHNLILRDLHDRLRAVPVFDPILNKYRYSPDFPVTVGDFFFLQEQTEATERVLVPLVKFFDLDFESWDSFVYAGDRGPSSPFEATLQSPPPKLGPGPVELDVKTASVNGSDSNMSMDEAQRDEEREKATQKHWDTAFAAVAGCLGVDLPKVSKHQKKLAEKPRAEIDRVPLKRRAVEYLPNLSSKRATFTDIRDNPLPNMPGPATPKSNKLTLADVTGMADVRVSPKSEHTEEVLMWGDRPDRNFVPQRHPTPSSSGDGVRANGSGSSIKPHSASRVLAEPVVPQVTRPVYPSATTVSPLSTPSLDIGFDPQPPFVKRFESSPADDSIPPPLSAGLGHTVDTRTTTPRKSKRSSAKGKGLSVHESPTQPFTNPPALAPKPLSTSGSAERTSPGRPIGGRKQ